MYDFGLTLLTSNSTLKATLNGKAFFSNHLPQKIKPNQLKMSQMGQPELNKESPYSF